MKKRIYRVLSVALTVMLLTGLLFGLAATPAAAQTGNKWVKYPTPVAGEAGGWFMSPLIKALGPLDVAFDNSALYCGAWIDANDDDVQDAGEIHILKSVKGSNTYMGKTWTETDYSETAGISTDLIVDMVCSPLDANVIYVTDGTTVFWSNNGGTTFEALSSPPIITPNTITSIDVGYIGTAPYIFAGTAGDTGSAGDDDVYVCEQAVYGMPWAPLSVETERATALSGDINVFDVKVSRTFSTDQMVIAVVGDAVDTYLTLKYGGAQWGATVPDTAFHTSAFVTAASGDASIALRDTFDSSRTSGNMVVLCGLDTGAAAPNGGLYTFSWDAQAEYTGNWTKSRTVGAGGAANTYDVYDLDVSGTTTQTGMITGKMTGTGPVYVRFAKDYSTTRNVWAVTNGTNLACSFTTASTTFAWNQVSLIQYDIGTITDIQPTADWFFMVTTQSVTGLPNYNGDSLWRHDGKDWKRIYHVSKASWGSPPTYFNAFSDVQTSAAWQTDLTVMVGDLTLANPRSAYSTNGGDAFTVQSTNAAPGAVNNWLIINRDNRLLAGDSGNIYKTINNAGWIWMTYNVGSTSDVYGLAVDPKSNNNVLAGTTNGEVFMSGDMGLTWDQVGGPGSQVGGGSGITFPVYDPNFATNSTIYATKFGYDGVWRFVIGEDSEWQLISGVANTWPEDEGAAASINPEALYGFAVAGNGTLYTTDDDNQPVSRCVNPTAAVIPATNAPYFEPLSTQWPGGYAWGLWITAGSNKLWTIAGNQAEIWTYNDEVTTPSLGTPVKGATSQRTDEVTLTWGEVKNATMYQVYLATDSQFANIERAVQTTQESVRITGLEDGITYYWKVAVFAQSPCVSLWSTTFDFTTALGAAQWNPFVGGVPEAPANGATGVSRTPTFAWNAADWATGYEFQMGTDPTFATTLDSKTGSNAVTTTVYTPAVTLDYSTTYYWRVRAVKGSTMSQYGVGVFTTEAAPAPTPTPPTPTPTPPTPTPTPEPVTPMYIWVIIGIGAILVIAVIILIIRTRRVA